MTDQYEPSEQNDSARTDSESSHQQLSPTTPDLNAGAQYPTAPAEQPYTVPTEQQAWSAAQQYGGFPSDSYGSGPYGPYGQYVQGQYATGQYGQGHYGQYGSGQYGQGHYGQYGSGQYSSGQHSQYSSGQPYGYQPTSYLPGQPGYPGGHGFPPYGHGYWAPPPAGPAKKQHRGLYISVAAAVVAALAVGGVAVAVDRANNSSQQSSLASPNQNSQSNPFSGGSGSGSGSSGSGNSGGGSFGFGNGGSAGGSAGGTGGGASTGTATSAQSVGVVDINTTIDFGQGKAAGTGMVLSSDGEVLTNNHVVQDSTAISVTVVSTGKTYTAKVVGTDPTDDVAVIQLQNASGLATAKLGDSSSITPGTAVTAVGNAGGTGGTPSSATGTVTGLNQSITASDENGTNPEKLTGMIQVNADIQAGDSGGPLYENSSGTIIGMDTAASASGSRFRDAASTTGFAIPISKATSIAKQIESGAASSTIHLGYPAFLGVQLSAADQTGGATIAGVVQGSAAANAGLQAGDTITSINGTPVASASALTTEMQKFKPGDQVKLGYTDAAGQSQAANVTLGQGPAD